MSSARCRPFCVGLTVFTILVHADRNPAAGNYNNPLFLNTLRPRQNGRRFADDTFKRIFRNENVRISIKISLMFVPKGPINNIPALVQIMARRRTGDKPLSEPMMVSLLTQICVTRPQWVNPTTWISISCLHTGIWGTIWPFMCRSHTGHEFGHHCVRCYPDLSAWWRPRYFKFQWQSIILYNFCTPGDVIQNWWRNLEKSRGTF